MQLTLFGIALILIVAWLYLQRRKPAVPSAESNSLTETGSGRYPAVSIKFDSNACQAAKTNCRFTHHKDRRSGGDRRSPFAAAGFGGGTGSFEKERREMGGRRKEDADDVDDF